MKRLIALFIATIACWSIADEPRQPREVARELLEVYGHKLDQAAYIPALAVYGRLRFGELTKDAAFRGEVDEILRPYSSGEKSPVPKSGSEQAGHLIFAAMAQRTDGEARKRYLELVRSAADQIFDEQGSPRDLMPYHNEMSDAVFMAGPILCEAGELTADAKYFAAAKHCESMRKLCLREDGLYRHSPLCEAAWGRGNGFPALGLAWCLTRMPEDNAARPEMLKAFQSHMTALLKFQDADGMWHQVIDEPTSYAEFSCTVMIGFAMLRGVEQKWLEREKFQPAVDRAWQAVVKRIEPGGRLIDVCEGTGKQKTLDDYLRRRAIRGVDDRGGAMALLFAIERMAVER